MKTTEGAQAELGSGPPRCAETHISWVLLTQDRAFKIAKPVVTDVLDQGTIEARRHSCEREVDLNSRIAPDVYLGVGNIELGGGALEPVIVMRRMPDDRRLSTLLDSPEARDLVSAVAREIAAFHASTLVLNPDEARTVSSGAALSTRWTDDLTALRELLQGGNPEGGDTDSTDEGRPPSPATPLLGLTDDVGVSAQRYLSGRDPLFRDRIDRGMIRDGHGDLLADDVFCLDDGPRILDCLAFSDHLRCNDVLADVAFLVMDLERLGHADLGHHFLAAYDDFSGERHPGSLAHLYVAQRALVRAKVSALRAEDPSADSEVECLVHMTADHLDRACVRIALVGGIPGSGKSTIAGLLADERGWPVLASDEIRRDLGLRYADLQDDSAYDAATVAMVYREMRRRAKPLVEGGVSVIMDATWTSNDEREKARRLAKETFSEIVEIRCDAPTALSRARVAERKEGSQSEATPDVVDTLAERSDPWPEAHVINTEGESPERIWPLDAIEPVPDG